jgi:hypothetical protein
LKIYDNIYNNNGNMNCLHRPKETHQLEQILETSLSWENCLIEKKIKRLGGFTTKSHIYGKIILQYQVLREE